MARTPVSQKPIRSGMSRTSVTRSSRPSLAVVDELEDRVERQVLHAGPGVDAAERGRSRSTARMAAVGPGVAIVVRTPDEGSLRVQQAVVHAPRVDADAGRRVGPARRDREPGQDLAVQTEDVPVQAVGQRDGSVREPVHLLELEQVGFDPADDDPSARCPEVDRDDAAVGPGAGHRRNAAATPASTGMCRPVVWARSPPVSANTAAATCSGRTSFLRSVRCA